MRLSLVGVCGDLWCHPEYKKKADVANTQLGMRHVGLLFNEPAGKTSLLFSESSGDLSITAEPIRPATIDHTARTGQNNSGYDRWHLVSCNIVVVWALSEQ
jgi:hypothetical protein